MTHPLAAVVLGLVGLAAGPVVPSLIRAVPPVRVDAGQEGDMVEYADIAVVADRPGLAGRAVLGSGIAAAVLGLGLGWTWPLLYLLPLVPLSVALTAIDCRTRILPSRLIYPAYLLVLAGIPLSWLSAGRPDGTAPLLRTLVGATIAFGFFYAVWFVFPRGMGFGDVRLSGVLGLALAYLGWSQLAIGLYGGFLLGGVIGGGLTLARVVDRSGYPFGPFMLVGALLGIAAGEPIVSALVG